MAGINLATIVLALVGVLVSLIVQFTYGDTIAFASKLVLLTVWGLADVALFTAGTMILLNGIIERSVLSIVGGLMILTVPTGITSIVIWLWATGAP